MQLRDRASQPFGHSGDVGHVIPADGEHHRIGAQCTAVRFQQKSAVGPAFERRDGDALEHRRCDMLGVVLDIGDDLVAQHEALWIAAAVRKTRKLTLPIGRHQAESIPTLGLPGMCNHILLEDDVLDAVPPQMVARGQPRLTPADDGDADTRRERCIPHVLLRPIPETR